jgi:hypothetical protein
LHGPAERTVIEPWLTDLSHLALNAFAETTGAEIDGATTPEAVPALAVVESLPAPRPVVARLRAALAKAA